MELQISIRLFLYTLFFRFKEAFNKNTTKEASGNIVLTQFLYFCEYHTIIDKLTLNLAKYGVIQNIEIVLVKLQSKTKKILSNLSQYILKVDNPIFSLTKIPMHIACLKPSNPSADLNNNQKKNNR